jgi:VanZ family protein
MPLRLKSLLWIWLPVLLWLAVIGFESTAIMSADNTGDILYKLLKAVFGPIGHHKLELLNYVFRKVGHFTGYGILGLLFFRAIRRTALELKPLLSLGETARQRLLRWAVGAVLCTAVVASLDELHQTFLPSRTGAFHDVVLDTFGAIFILTIILIANSRKLTTGELE